MHNCKTDSVRNNDGLWINTQVFREEAIHFSKYGYYTADPWGTPAWLEYWKEQIRRCTKGYTTGGATITGHHYAYLNFSQIKRTMDIQEGKKAVRKKPFFPDFWDGDYNYFWNKQLAWEGFDPKLVDNLGLLFRPSDDQSGGGYNMIVGKARRKGFSYKNASILANTYNTIRDSLSIIGAFDKEFVGATLKMTKDILNFQGKNTGIAKHRHILDQKDHFRASYKWVDERGTVTERGYMSEVLGLTFRDNPDAARGKDAVEFYFEEAGKFPNLEKSWLATMATAKDGDYQVGQLTAFGTGGDMERGTVDFAKMFYNPVPYGAIAYENIWDDEENASTKKCSFFFPEALNRNGFIDENGNSLIVEAELADAKKREEIVKNSNDSTILDSHKQEHPRNPKEAFLTNASAIFPLDILEKQLNRIENESLDTLFGVPGRLERDTVTKKLKFVPDFSPEAELKPIRSFKNQNAHVPKSSSLVVFEPVSKNTKGGDYCIGYDPYAQDDANGDSLGAIYVYKKVIKGEPINNQIVAYYIGRMREVDDLNKLFYDLCEYYQTPGMHENMFLHVKQYGKYHNKIQWLQGQPESIITAAVKNSKVSRKFGIHMNKQIKDFGEKLIRSWILGVKEYDEDGDPVYNISTLYDKGLIEELIAYDGVRNTDRVIALMLILFDYEETKLEYTYEDEEQTMLETYVSLGNYINKRKKLLR